MSAIDQAPFVKTACRGNCVGSSPAECLQAISESCQEWEGYKQGWRAAQAAKAAQMVCGTCGSYNARLGTCGAPRCPFYNSWVDPQQINAWGCSLWRRGKKKGA